MHIGLIGGIGVAATVVYYQRLTAACPENLDLTIVHADVQTLIRNNLADDRQAQAEVYAVLIDRLKNAGADCAAITSLGGHFCYEETLQRASLPLISAVAPLDDHFVAKGYDTVGLLGTDVVMRTELYGQLAQTKAIAPEALQDVGDTYRDMAVAGSCTSDLAAYFVEEGQKLMAAGADAVVLAGTDLNLAFDQVAIDYPIVDALDVHVAVLADLATGRTQLG